MLFEGSTIVAGHARAIVVATGVGTAAHRAISAVVDVESSAGVQARLRDLTGKVLPLTLAGGAAVSGLALLRRATLRQAVADGVAIAVAAVPEGLPLVATLSQFAAAQRLSTRGVLVRAPADHRGVGPGGHDLLRQDRHTHRKPAPPSALGTGRNQSQGPFPGVADPEATQVLRAAGARVIPTARVAGARARHRRGNPQGRANPMPAAAIPTGTCSQKSRSSPAVVSPPRSARSATDPTKPVLMLKGAPEVVLPRCRFADPQADMDHAESLVHTSPSRACGCSPSRRAAGRRHRRRGHRCRRRRRCRARSGI